MNILYTTEQVQQRIREMAQQIITEHHETKPLFVCLLKGAVPFTAQLMTEITEQDPDFHPEVVYMHASAYGTEHTAGEVTMYSSVEPREVAGRTVIVLDDCLDRGVTYGKIKQLLLSYDASAVSLAVLVNKDVQREGVESPALIGFTTPDVWLTGMGMDDADTAPEARRWAGYIAEV